MRNRLNRIGLSLCVLALGLAAVQAGQQPRKPGMAAHPAIVKAAKKQAASKAMAHKAAAHKAHKLVRRARRHARHVAMRRHARVARVALQEHIEGNVAEDSLYGVHLYDNMTTLLNLFGSPDEIQPLQMAGGTMASSGFGGGGGYGGPRGAGGPGGNMGPTGGGAGADYEDPFGFGDQPLNLQPPGMGMGGPRGRGMGGPGMPPGMGQGQGAGYPGVRGPAGMPPGFRGPGGGGGYPGARPGFPGGAGPGGGPAAPTGGGGAAEEATYTRWVYNRNDNKFGFVVDKNGRIIEIEAIGITNPKVRTKRSVTFGSDFATVIRRYGDPDGYDIAGDNITLRYLVHDKVAFKLTRMGPKQPHEVTGIVVAAGKP